MVEMIFVVYNPNPTIGAKKLHVQLHSTTAALRPIECARALTAGQPVRVSVRAVVSVGDDRHLTFSPHTRHTREIWIAFGCVYVYTHCKHITTHHICYISPTHESVRD